jgi:broad specificity phosphatase PhoE
MTAITTRWFWIRHAPVIGHDGRIYGSCDVDCDVSDGPLFRDLAAVLPAEALWFTSHLLRTRKTALAILDHWEEAPELREFADLAEQDFGEWQGLSHAELAARDDAAYHHFWLAPARHQPPGGESFADLVTRVSARIRALTEAHAGRDIVAVTHGGTIRAALAEALALDPETALSFTIGNCSLTSLDYIGPRPSKEPRMEQGAWRVNFVNLSPATARNL